MANSPTARSKAFLAKDGWLVAVVERWNAFARIRQDLFGFIDILAIREGATLGVQTTTTTHQAERLDKAMATPNLRAWLLAGNRFEVHGWAKKGKAKRWEVTVTPVGLEDVP